MAKNRNSNKKALEKFQKNLTEIKALELELTQLGRRLETPSAGQTARWIEVFDEFCSQMSVSRLLVRNTKEVLAVLCRQDDAESKKQAWQMLVDYAVAVARMLKLAESVEASISSTLASEKALMEKFSKEIIWQIECLKQAEHEFRQQVIGQNNFDLNTLFSSAQTVQVTYAKKHAGQNHVISNPLAIPAQLITREVNAVAVNKQAIVQQVISQQLNHATYITRFNLVANGQTIPAILGAAKTPSKQSIMFITGAGDHPFNGLDIAAEIAAKLGANYLAVNHVTGHATHFGQPISKIIAGVNYLINVKGMKLEDITLFGHSNGGRLALEVADYFKQTYGKAPSVVLNNTYNTLEEVSVNVAKKALTKRSAHKPAPSFGESPAEHAVSRFAVKQLNNAFKQHHSDYQAETIIQRLGPQQVASVYTGNVTQYNEQGQKLTKPRDEILGKGQQGRIHNKKAKRENPKHHEAVGRMSFKLSSGGRCRYKDLYQEGHGGHLVIKRYVSDGTMIHNKIDTDCLVYAARRLKEQQALAKGLHTSVENLQQRFVSLLNREGIIQQTCSFPIGLSLGPDDMLLLKETFAQLIVQPDLDLPTQQQLMALFQADGYVAELIANNESAMKRMIVGNGHSRQQHMGLEFLEQRLSKQHLESRTIQPDGLIDGIGSYLEPEQAERLYQQVRTYESKLQRAPIRMSQGLFETKQFESTHSVFAQKKQHKRQQALDINTEPQTAWQLIVGRLTR